MRTMKFYQELQMMECLQGDTSPEFSVEVENADDCTMDLILENIENIGVPVLQKRCAKVASEDVIIFSVRLTSEDTKQLSGLYRMHFHMTDENNLEYAKIVGKLNVRRIAQKEDA